MTRRFDRSFRFANDLVVSKVLAERVVKPVTYESDCEVGDVDADPAPVETLCGGDRCAAATEGVKDDIALVARCVDDAFQQGFGLLGGIAKAFIVP